MFLLGVLLRNYAALRTKDVGKRPCATAKELIIYKTRQSWKRSYKITQEFIASTVSWGLLRGKHRCEAKVYGRVDCTISEQAERRTCQNASDKRIRVKRKQKLEQWANMLVGTPVTLARSYKASCMFPRLRVRATDHRLWVRQIGGVVVSDSKPNHQHMFPTRPVPK
jgi:hypothetical protein